MRLVVQRGGNSLCNIELAPVTVFDLPLSQDAKNVRRAIEEAGKKGGLEARLLVEGSRTSLLLGRDFPVRLVRWDGRIADMAEEIARTLPNRQWSIRLRQERYEVVVRDGVLVNKAPTIAHASRCKRRLF